MRPYRHLPLPPLPLRSLAKQSRNRMPEGKHDAKAYGRSGHWYQQRGYRTVIADAAGCIQPCGCITDAVSSDGQKGQPRQ